MKDRLTIRQTLQLDSPAKINLVLDILRKREDGYHDLRTVLQKISLHDTLRFTLTEAKGISITTTHPGLPTGKGNLVYGAARSVLQKSEFKGGVRIHIAKRIPVGAGLGGGSSNAAATLTALNRLLANSLSKKELMGMGSELGADVPFFFMKGAAVGTGIGDRLNPIDLPRLWYILIYPNFEVSARWAYEHFVLTEGRFHYKIRTFPKTAREISSVLRNDLETAVSRRYPQIEMMKNLLLSSGALGALMTGSGPTVFGVFAREGGASQAYKKIRRMVKEEGWIVLKAHSISA
jgi:4-diphosphocytidyl-2-C-methyl-D-erythritol kinase